MIAGWYEAGYDLILSPTLGEPPAPLGSFNDSGDDPMRALRRAHQTAMFTAGYNASGQPAISLPLSRSEAGLPIGVQLAAPLGREDVLIAIGAQLERAQPWIDRRPPTWAGAAATEMA
jgi:amidase